jgi:hypothetical protein
MRYREDESLAFGANLSVNVKLKNGWLVSAVHVMKACRASRGVLPFIRNFGTRRR